MDKKLDRILAYARSLDTDDPISVRYICQRFRVRKADLESIKNFLREHEVSYLDDYVVPDHTLFVPPGISWEAQIDRGIKLIRDGYSVWVHAHSTKDECTPNGAVKRCGRLQIIDDRATVVSEQDGGATK